MGSMRVACLAGSQVARNATLPRAMATGVDAPPSGIRRRAHPGRERRATPPVPAAQARNSSTATGVLPEECRTGVLVSNDSRPLQRQLPHRLSKVPAGTTGFSEFLAKVPMSFFETDPGADA